MKLRQRAYSSLLYHGPPSCPSLKSSHYYPLPCRSITFLSAMILSISHPLNTSFKVRSCHDYLRGSTPSSASPKYETYSTLPAAVNVTETRSRHAFMQPKDTMLQGREKSWDQIPSEEIKVGGNVAGAGDSQSTRIIAPEDDATDKILFSKCKIWRREPRAFLWMRLPGFPT